MFVGSQTGAVYALDANAGCTQWSFRADQPLSGGLRITDTKGVPALYFTDGAATVYALDAESGKVIWKVHPSSFVGAMATGTLQVPKGVVFQPMSSLEFLFSSSMTHSVRSHLGA